MRSERAFFCLHISAQVLVLAFSQFSSTDIRGFRVPTARYRIICRENRMVRASHHPITWYMMPTRESPQRADTSAHRDALIAEAHPDPGTLLVPTLIDSSDSDAATVIESSDSDATWEFADQVNEGRIVGSSPSGEGPAQLASSAPSDHEVLPGSTPVAKEGAMPAKRRREDRGPTLLHTALRSTTTVRATPLPNDKATDFPTWPRKSVIPKPAARHRASRGLPDAPIFSFSQ